jgi:hypothetical protein
MIAYFVQAQVAKRNSQYYRTPTLPGRFLRWKPSLASALLRTAVDFGTSLEIGLQCSAFPSGVCPRQKSAVCGPSLCDQEMF